MREHLPNLICLAGALQLFVPIASALVPLQLNWREELHTIPKLHRQLYWTYGGYVVLAIVSLGLICLFNSKELASGSGLARGVCGYIAAFWGIRLGLQAVFDVKSFLTMWWLTLGYHTLTLLFVTSRPSSPWRPCGRSGEMSDELTGVSVIPDESTLRMSSIQTPPPLAISSLLPGGDDCTGAAQSHGPSDPSHSVVRPVNRSVSARRFANQV